MSHFFQTKSARADPVRSPFEYIVIFLYKNVYLCFKNTNPSFFKYHKYFSPKENCGGIYIRLQLISNLGYRHQRTKLKFQKHERTTTFFLCGFTFIMQMCGRTNSDQNGPSNLFFPIIQIFGSKACVLRRNVRFI